MSPQEAAGALQRAGWPRELWPVMIAIGKAESGLRIDAVNTHNRNGSIDRGWLQINSVHKGWEPARLLSDPVYTATAGLHVWYGGGLSAWATYTNGAYRKFLPEGQQGAKAPVTPPTLTAPHDTGTSSSGSSSSGGGVLGTIGNVAGDVAGAVGTVALGPLGLLLDGKGNPITDVGHAVSSLASTSLHAAVWVANPHNWLRVVEVIGGAAAVLLALKMLASSGVGGPVGMAARGVSKAEHAAHKVASDTAGKAAMAAAL